MAGLDEGLRQIAEGKLIPHEEVKKEFRSWLIEAVVLPEASVVDHAVE